MRLAPSMGAGLTILALAPFLSAGAATAGDASCLWKSLPTASREQLLKSNGPEEVEAAIEPAALVLSTRSCTKGLPSDAAGLARVSRAAYMALFGYASHLAAAERLKERFEISQSQLDGAWTSLSAAEKSAFGERVHTPLLDRTIESVSERLWPGRAAAEDQKEQLTFFLLGRGFAERFQNDF